MGNELAYPLIGLNEMDEASLAAAVERAIEHSPTVASIRRAIVGDEEEGNTGLLTRVVVVERRVFWMIWLMPIWITAGTSIGTLLSNVWGL